jgi:hypothetical protein
MTKDEGMPSPPAGLTAQTHIGNHPDQRYYDPDPEMVWVACVLHGTWPHPTDKLREKVPDLSERYVEHLYEMVSRYMPRNIRWRFVCFTDRTVTSMPGIPIRTLPRGYNGWFNKLYLFSPYAFPVGARVLYFDLDTAIVGDLSAFATVPLDRPVFLRDVWASGHAASGLFSFRSGPALYPIWKAFEKRGLHRPPYAPVTKGVVPNWEHPNGAQWRAPEQIRTDEEWLHQYLYPDAWANWQQLLPGAAVSYPLDMVKQRKALTDYPDARVVFFHGWPRPHQVVKPWNPHYKGVMPELAPVVTGASIKAYRE